MKLKSGLFAIVILLLSACSSSSLLKEQRDTPTSANGTQKTQFSCTAIQGKQSVNLPVLTGKMVVGTIREPLKLTAKPFDILFDAFDDGASLHLTIQANAPTIDEALRTSYWGPYPTAKTHVEISRSAAKIFCFSITP